LGISERAGDGSYLDGLEDAPLAPRQFRPLNAFRRIELDKFLPAWGLEDRM
jgi:hypothetical protein